MPAGVEFVPYGDIPALRAAVDDTVAAVFLEPILGEAGVVPAPDGYLAAARAITAEHGTLLVIDEVQTGIGRTGSWFAHSQVRHRARCDHPGQGAGRRPADRRRHRHRRCRPAVAARRPRLDLRREPGLRGGRAGRPGHHRHRRPARPCRRTGQAHRHRRRGSRPSADRPRPRRRPAARHRAHREHWPGNGSRRPGGRLHHQRAGSRGAPAGPAVDPHHRAGRLVRRGPARHPADREPAGRNRKGSCDDHRPETFPARRRPVARRAG